MLRSYWDVAKSLRRGELVHLLRKFWQTGRRLGGHQNQIGQFCEDEAVHPPSAHPATLRTVRPRRSRRRLKDCALAFLVN